MNAEIVAVEKRYDLNTKQMGFYAVVKVGLREFRMKLETEQQADELLDYGMDRPSEAEAPAPLPAPVQEGAEVIHWALLPDETLPAHMKRALSMLNVPPVLEVGALTELVQDIMSNFTAEDWAQVNEASLNAVAAPKPPPPTAPSPAPAVQQPPIGTVTWTDGRPIMPSMMNPARTVPSDSNGYPIVESVGRDPGEVVGVSDDYDEDGVGQL